jgi:hypothetical protein
MPLLNYQGEETHYAVQNSEADVSFYRHQKWEIKQNKKCFSEGISFLAYEGLRKTLDMSLRCFV